jgi:hypothetical protein
MKSLVCSLFTLLVVLSIDAQCVDVYNTPTECPTAADSLVLYNNAIKVVNFYERNPDYVKTSSDKIITAYDKLHIFQDLVDARRMFKVIRRQFPALPGGKYKDVTFDEYYQEVDDYRFYQRELENQTVNREAASSLYDLRISPVVVNKYTCINSNSVYSGDLVNIPLYIPVIVKPFMMLTDSELVLRNSLLQATSPVVVNFVKPIIKVVVKDTIPLKPIKVPVKSLPKVVADNSSEKKHVEALEYLIRYNLYSPVYYFEDPKLGGPALIGFMTGRTFVKIRKEDYQAYAVPTWAQKLLEDKIKLNDFLKTLFGDYYQTIN